MVSLHPCIPATRCPWSRAIGAARGRAVTLTVQEPTGCDPAPLHPDTGSKSSMALQHSPGVPWSRASRRQGDPDKTIPGNRNFRALGASIRCLLSRRRLALRVSLSSGAAPLVVAPRRPRHPPYMARATRRLLWHQSYGTNLFHVFFDATCEGLYSAVSLPIRCAQDAGQGIGAFGLQGARGRV